MAVESDHLRYLERQPDPLIGEDEPTADVVVELPDGGESGRRPFPRPLDAGDPPREPSAGAESAAAGAIGHDEAVFEPGQLLCGRYELQRVVGRGGACVVLAARDLRRQAAGDTEAKVAIKALRPEQRHDEAARHRLTAEFQQLQQLSHPGIVRVYDLDRHGDDWFLVMELLEGVSLAGLMRHEEGSGIPGSQALGIVRACADALGWAHGRGVVHGDIKPGNVFVTRDGVIRLLDFGTASPRQDGEGPGEANPAGVATPAYASPQVLQGQRPTVADDVYSLACMAFELLAGAHPFDRVSAREAWAREMLPKPTPDLGAGVRAALERGLSFDRDRRPSSVAEFIRLLDADAPRAGGPVPVAANGATSRARLAGGWVVAAVLAGIIAAVLLWGGESGPESPAATVPQEPTAVPAGRDADSTLENTPPVQQVPPAAPDVASASAATPEAASKPVPQAVLADQRIGFAGTAVVVSRTAPAAAILLRRSNGSAGRAVVTWRIAEGSARSGRDFSGPLSGTLVLADGQEGGTVFVPLLVVDGALVDRSFAVILDRVRGPALERGKSRVDVTLRSFIQAEPPSLAARD
jgi:hypothetical protein